MKIKHAQLAKHGPIGLNNSIWILIQGNETHQKRIVAERLREQLLSGDDAFNLDQLDANDRWEKVADSFDQAKRDKIPTRADKVLSLAQAFPFLGSGRVLILKNAHLLDTDSQKKIALQIDSIPSMNHVILITGESEDNKKPQKMASALETIIEKQGLIIDCSSLTEAEAAIWVKDTLHTWGQTIEPAAVDILIKRVGTELRRLQIEVDKLSLMIGDAKVIREADVERMTPRLAEESVFRLADAISDRNGFQALNVLHELMEVQFETPFRIFPMIVRQFRLIWQVKILLEHGWQPNSPADRCPGVDLIPDQAMLAQFSGWMGRKLANSARKMTWEALTAAYQAMLECDMASKAIEGVPRQDAELALEILCAKLVTLR
ncbi:MAG: DNA polymerase III subunit delta [bacterium]